MVGGAGPGGDARLAALEELVELRALEQVLIAYFDRVDARDAEGAAALFTEDTRCEIMTGKVLEGRERFARALGRVLAQYRRTSHHLTNVRGSVQGDEGETFAYVYAFHRMEETGEPWHLWVRIVDRFVRTPDGWRIAEHRLLGIDSVPPRADIPDEWYAGHPGHPGSLAAGG